MAGHELPPKPSGLVIGQERARGSYGTVHSGELDGKPVVVKKLHRVLLQVPRLEGKSPIVTGAVKKLLPSWHTRVMRDGYLCVFWRD